MGFLNAAPFSGAFAIELWATRHPDTAQHRKGLLLFAVFDFGHHDIFALLPTSGLSMLIFTHQAA